jgi:hypothetical protein
MPLWTPPPGQPPPQKKGSAQVVIKLEFDSRAVSSFKAEGKHSVADVLEIAAAKLSEEIERVRHIKEYTLKDGKSFKIEFKVDMFDSALGVEAAPATSRAGLVFSDD